MLLVKKSNFIGKNGLLIPLDEVFESKFIVVEVLFIERDSRSQLDWVFQKIGEV